MIPRDTLALFNTTEEGKDCWKGGAYVAEVLKRAVVVERRLVGWESCESWKSEQVGLTSLVQLPDVITLTSWS